MVSTLIVMLLRLDRPWVLAALVASLGASCKCGRDKPYVPYSIESSDGAVDAAADAALATAPVDAGPQSLTLVRPPPGSRTIAFDGAAVGAGATTFTAPDGQTFVAGAAYDWDGDAVLDAATVLKADAANNVGNIYAVALYHGTKGGPSAPMVIASSPPLAGCSGPPEVPVRMTRRGKSSVAVEVGATCPNRTPSRWLLVGATEGKAPRARFSVGIADPPGAHPLIVEADALDRDSDGIDDVILRASLEGAAPPFEPGPRVTGSLVWLDRSAGLSRDPEEPEASFRAISTPLSGRATRAKEAALVPVAVRQLRHLAHALCAEGGAARLVQLAGATLPACAGSRALEEAGLAEARSHATSGDALRAALAFERAQKPPAARTPARVKEVQTAIEKLAPPLESTSMRLFAAVPDEPAREVPAFGPLAYEPDGRLLIRTRAGLVRADPVHGDEADAGRQPWLPVLVGGAAAENRPTFVMAMNACDGVAIRAIFTKPDAPQGSELLLPIVPSLAERCVVPRGEPASVRPLAWGPSGLEAIVAGEPVLVTGLNAGESARVSLLAAPLDAPGLPGSAKSPDGRFVVAPTPLGLLVRGPAGSRLLRAKELEGATADVRYCAVSNDGKRVACIKNKRVVAGIWEY